MSSRCHQRHTGNFGRKLAAQIARQMVAVLPNMVAQLHQQLAPAPTPAPVNQDVANPKCNYKYFNSRGPPKFDGSEGATDLLRWPEGMENTFLSSDCPENLKVRHGTSAPQKGH